MTSAMDAHQLRGKSALVTGASSGIGAHFVRILAAEGVKVVAAARRMDRLDQLVTEIKATGDSAQAAELDVCSEESVAALFGENGAFDIVINNAGVSIAGSAIEQSMEDFDAHYLTNVRGAQLVASHAARAMRDAGTLGSIVNVASILGLRQAGAVTGYATSKAAVIQLTKQLALEWARYGIRVNALAPGYISTELNKDFLDSEQGQALIRRIPQRRLGQLSDLEAPLLFLVSPANSYITGIILPVDGGHLISTL